MSFNDQEPYDVDEFTEIIQRRFQDIDINDVNDIDDIDYFLSNLILVLLGYENISINEMSEIYETLYDDFYTYYEAFDRVVSLICTIYDPIDLIDSLNNQRLYDYIEYISGIYNINKNDLDETEINNVIIMLINRLIDFDFSSISENEEND